MHGILSPVIMSVVSRIIDDMVRMSSLAGWCGVGWCGVGVGVGLILCHHVNH